MPKNHKDHNSIGVAMRVAGAAVAQYLVKNQEISDEDHITGMVGYLAARLQGQPINPNHLKKMGELRIVMHANKIERSLGLT
jgi:hypothetical protein